MRAARISDTRCIAAAAATTRASASGASVTPSKPSGYSSAMKAVVMLPEMNRS